MKKYQVFFAVLGFMTFTLITGYGQNFQKDSTGLPGDNFSLQGALDLFSKANTLEDFEKSLNIENNNVNNLDLNLDGKIDYIRVIDRMDKKAHAITLQAIVGDNDFQDIAVIEIEQKSADNAIAQIVGDEDIYGQELYVEANPDNSIIDDNGQLIKKGPSPYAEYSPIRIYFNVWAWPCVQYIYAPVYVVYVSPWHWHTYPMWWNPWRPWHWHNFYSHGWHYHNHYIVASHPRVYGARSLYAPHRSVSHNVYVRNEKVINNYRVTNKIVINKNDSRHRNQAGYTKQNEGNNPRSNQNVNSRDRQNNGLETRDRNSSSKTDNNATTDRRNTNNRNNDVMNNNRNNSRSDRSDKPIGNKDNPVQQPQSPVSKDRKPSTYDRPQRQVQPERPARQNPSFQQNERKNNSSRSDIQKNSSNQNRSMKPSGNKPGSSRNRG